MPCVRTGRRAGSINHPQLRKGVGHMAEEERQENREAGYEVYSATAQEAKSALLKAGWALEELTQLERWFRGEYLSLRHPDREEL